MIKFKSKALPAPSVGFKTTGGKIVVPDQSLSLMEILERFTRGEPLAIGRDANFDDSSDDDLEKVAHMDMVDRDEFIEKQKDVQRKFDRQEKKKAADEKARLEKIAIDKIAEEKRKADSAGGAK